jgi:uncharacterized ferritin-like protein (DUF455 family)
MLSRRSLQICSQKFQEKKDIEETEVILILYRDQGYDEKAYFATGISWVASLQRRRASLNN